MYPKGIHIVMASLVLWIAYFPNHKDPKTCCVGNPLAFGLPATVPTSNNESLLKWSVAWKLWLLGWLVGWLVGWSPISQIGRNARHLF